MDENVMTPEEMAEIQKFALGTGPEEKHNIHTFLHEVSVAKDTTKTGFLDKEELGTPRLPVRSLKELALFCEEIADMGYFSEYFRKEAEIVTSTSLSKNAKLLETAVVSRRQLEDVTKQHKKRGGGGLFAKKDKGGAEQQ